MAQRSKFGLVLGTLFIGVSVFLVISGFMLFNQLEQDQFLNNKMILLSILRQKADMISAWKADKINDASLIVSSKAFLTAALSSKDDPVNNMDKKFDKFKTMIFEAGFMDYEIVDREGKFLYQMVFKTQRGICADAVDNVKKAFDTGEIQFGDINRCDMISDICIDIIVPLKEKTFEIGSSGTGGVCVILKMDQRDELYSIIQYWPEQSETSEALLVRREGDEVVFLNDLRFVKSASLNLRLSAMDKDLPAALATNVEEGAFIGVDYRGAPVQAFTKKIPSTPWFLVVKTDIDEILAPAKIEKQMLIVMITLSILFAGALVTTVMIIRRRNYYKQLLDEERGKREMAANFETMIKKASDIVILLDSDRRIIEVNDRASTIYGYSIEELKGMDVMQLRTKEEVMPVEQQFDVKRAAEGVIYETDHRRKDGITFPVEVNLTSFEFQEKTYFLEIIRDITSRKELEKYIIDQYSVHRDVLESANSPIFSVDTGYKYTIFNTAHAKAMKALYGVEIKQGVNMLEYMKADSDKDKAKAKANFDRVFRGESFVEEAMSGEDRLIHRCFEINHVPVLGAEGTIIGAAVFARDVTEKKQREQDILRNDSRLESLIRITQYSSSDIQPLLDLALDEAIGLTESKIGYIYFYNDKARQFILNTWSKGVMKECSIIEQQTVYDLDKTGLWGEAVRQARPIIVNDYSVDNPMKKGCPEGHAKLDRFMTIPVFSGERIVAVIGLANKESDYDAIDVKQISLMMASVWSIVDRKRSETALVTEKERLLVTLRSIGDGVITTDVDGRIVLLNSVAEHLTGWTTEEAVGRHITEVFNIRGEKDGRICEDIVKSVMDKKAIIQMAENVILVDRKGVERLVSDSAAPIHDKDSKVHGAVLVFRDVTDKKKVEESLRSAQKLESIGILAGGIAHDFNNLLGAMFGNMEMALARSTEKGVTDYLKNAVGVYNRARDLTRQLLTFSKGGKPITEVMDIRPILQNSSTFALSGTDIKCEFDIRDDLWTCAVDENQIGQVIDNLVINARQAMPNSGTITVSAQNISEGAPLPPLLKRGMYVRISIGDTGIGIPGEYIDKVFDPFFTTKQEGSGLGLSTVYSIVKKHGGYIEVESELGTGTAFHIYLPASLGQKTKETTKIYKAFKGRGKILVMDDNQPILDMVVEMLSHMGFTVVTSTTGEQAMELYKEEKKRATGFDLVILDLTIAGGRGGKETIQMLREFDPKVKAVVSSGYSDDPIMSSPAEYGFSGKLAKPYKLEELNQLMREFFGGTEHAH